MDCVDLAIGKGCFSSTDERSGPIVLASGSCAGWAVALVEAGWAVAGVVCGLPETGTACDGGMGDEAGGEWSESASAERSVGSAADCVGGEVWEGVPVDWSAGCGAECGVGTARVGNEGAACDWKECAAVLWGSVTGVVCSGEAADACDGSAAGDGIATDRGEGAADDGIAGDGRKGATCERSEGITVDGNGAGGTRAACETGFALVGAGSTLCGAADGVWGEAAGCELAVVACARRSCWALLGALTCGGDADGAGVNAVAATGEGLGEPARKCCDDEAGAGVCSRWGCSGWLPSIAMGDRTTCWSSDCPRLGWDRSWRRLF